MLRKGSGGYLYRAKVGREAVVREESSSFFLSRVFDGARRGGGGAFFE